MKQECRRQIHEEKKQRKRERRNRRKQEKERREKEIAREEINNHERDEKLRQQYEAQVNESYTGADRNLSEQFIESSMEPGLSMRSTDVW